MLRVDKVAACIRQIKKTNQNIVLIENLGQFFSVLSQGRNRLFVFSNGVQ